MVLSFCVKLEFYLTMLVKNLKYFLAGNIFCWFQLLCYSGYFLLVKLVIPSWVGIPQLNQNQTSFSRHICVLQNSSLFIESTRCCLREYTFHLWWKNNDRFVECFSCFHFLLLNSSAFFGKQLQWPVTFLTSNYWVMSSLLLLALFNPNLPFQ